jgi:ribA/ribD-fused uncharacterized protein
MKFLKDIGDDVSDELLRSIIDSKTPAESKRIGHLNMPSIAEWDKVKVDAMMDILREKFKYQRFKDKLLETEDAIIMEDSYFDLFWGCGSYKKPGLNMLGKCLMKLRDELS